MSRLLRKSRTDIEIKSSGGVFDLLDNAIKDIWKLNDEEYDYIIETATDNELTLLIKETPNYSEVKSILIFIDRKLEEMYKNK